MERAVFGTSTAIGIEEQTAQVQVNAASPSYSREIFFTPKGKECHVSWLIPAALILTGYKFIKSFPNRWKQQPVIRRSIPYNDMLPCCLSSIHQYPTVQNSNECNCVGISRKEKMYFPCIFQLSASLLNFVRCLFLWSLFV